MAPRPPLFVLCLLALSAGQLLTTEVRAQGAPPPSSTAPPPPAPPVPTDPNAPPPAQPPPAQPPPTQPAQPPGAWQPAPQQPAPQQPYPQQPMYPQQPPPQGQPGQPPPGWGGYPPQGTPPPGYYGAGYGPPPPAGPPPPLPPEDPACCRFAVRFDPFDLIFRRLSFQAELAIWGPFAIEAEPSWIFASATENLDTTGGALAANALVYFTGDALKGFFAKLSVGFESFEATIEDPDLQKIATKDISSPLVGIGIGSSTVFGDEVGFNLAGGIGIGFLTAPPVELSAGRYGVTFYDKASSIQLMASLGLGVAF